MLLRLGRGLGYPIAVAPPKAELALLRLGRGLGFPVAIVPSRANGDTITVGVVIIAGVATGKKQVGGVSPPPPYWQLQWVDARARGRILTIRCRIISGIASGTITTASLRSVGPAIGSASVCSNNIITLHHSVYGGAAVGEKYLTDEEQLILMLEAA